MMKQVIIVRTDLNMRKGKLAAQVAHASMAFLVERLNPDTRDMYFSSNVVTLTTKESLWIDSIQKTIVLGVGSLKELEHIEFMADQRGIAAYKFIDLGLTEFKEPTVTCLALGPDADSVIDPLTGHLKLL